MLTNVATALFGLADLWVIGQLGDAEPQAGVELGAKFMLGLLDRLQLPEDRDDRADRPGGRPRRRGGAGGDPGAGARRWRWRSGSLLLAVNAARRPVRARAAPRPRRSRRARRGSMSASAIGAGCSGSLNVGPDRLADRAAAGARGARDRGRAPTSSISALDLLFVLGFGWGVAGVAVRDPALRRRQAARRRSRSPRASRRPRAALAAAGAARDLERGARWAPCSGSTATSSCAPCC